MTPMSVLRRQMAKIVHLFGERDGDLDFDAEMREHLKLLVEEYVHDGMTPVEAAQAARRQFGNATILTEDRRAMQTFPVLEEIWCDLRFAGRMLRKNPAFTAAAVLTLALSVGANTAIFSVVNGVLLRPLPFHDADRVMMLDERWLPRFPHFEGTLEHFVAWHEQSSSFDQLVAFAGAAFNLTSDDLPERISGARVSANLPSLLGVNPILGRTFRAQDDKEGDDRVVLLGHSLWRRRFGGDPQVLGRNVTLNNLSFKVIGVMPPEFRFPHDAEIWKPFGATAEDFKKGHFIRAIGRLRSGATREQAQAEMDLIMPRLGNPQVWSAAVSPLLEYYVGDMRTALFVLLGAAGFVLLIGCGNVANLQLARGAARQREISLRVSLGASRWSVIRQLITEGLLLAVTGGVLGVLVAFAGVGSLKTFLPAGIPRLDQVTLDGPSLLFTLGLSIFAGLVFGLVPALRLSDVGLHNPLKAGGRIAGAGAPGRMRNLFVISEVALALALMVAAGLLLKSFDRLLHVHPGFESEKVIAVTINLPSAQYRQPHLRTGFVTRLLDELESSPDVRQAAVSAGLPFSSADDVGIQIDRRPDEAGGSGTTANYYGVSPSYLQAMEIPLIRGRFFIERDSAACGGHQRNHG